ncbi:uncharacterized protein BDR25DRAFT_362913 [Lindgomyces ingoldianus]|uniref:Uncharacterized protein n=1 Tax=Lindgomyces ingoldianus TaxID=673940 RepID=A0ACB6Q9W1_9PLEO|nr:uncharacterized protein BDR25DRAFT_362913 [Lindgomyces ingoldianus]KAF2463373.1 hypothetical protein BDR25DRAFT_362913 [Lindgomyces ingoldianus]
MAGVTFFDGMNAERVDTSTTQYCENCMQAMLLEAQREARCCGWYLIFQKLCEGLLVKKILANSAFAIWHGKCPNNPEANFYRQVWVVNLSMKKVLGYGSDINTVHIAFMNEVIENVIMSEIVGVEVARQQANAKGFCWPDEISAGLVSSNPLPPKIKMSKIGEVDDEQNQELTILTSSAAAPLRTARIQQAQVLPEYPQTLPRGYTYCVSTDKRDIQEVLQEALAFQYCRKNKAKKKGTTCLYLGGQALRWKYQCTGAKYCQYLENSLRTRSHSSSISTNSS